MKIAFFDAKPYDREFFNAANSSIGFELNYIEAHLNSDTALLAKDHPAICAFVNDKIDAEAIDILCSQGVGLIALRCAGYNNLAPSLFTKEVMQNIASTTLESIKAYSLGQTLSNEVYSTSV